MVPSEVIIDDVQTVRVLVVDDQLTFRAVARTVVGLTPGFEVVAEAGSGPDSVDAAMESHPGLVLMDINLPGFSGIEATRQITAMDPSVVVVLMSTYDAASLPADAMDCGAARYTRKEDLTPALLREVWTREHLE